MGLKYNWKIAGNKKTLENIEQNILDQKLSHAYLLVGEEQIGKMIVARTVSQILQCPNNFCETCPSCKQIQNKNHLDTVEDINNGEAIKIESIKKLISRANLTTQSKYKIFILDNVSRLTIAAANSLLKILEEPPEKTLFFLTAPNLEGVLPTIVSRCRLLKFHKPSEEDLKLELKKIFPERNLETVLPFSLGKQGIAVSLLEDSELLEIYQFLFDKALEIINKPDLRVSFKSAEELSKDSTKAILFLDILTYSLKNLIEEETSPQSLSLPKISILLEKCLETKNFIKHNINVKLALENLFLAF